MAAPAGAGSCRTGRRPRSGACSSTVGDAAPVPGAPRDAHGFAPCAFGETGPMAMGSRAMDRMNRVRPPTGPYGPWTVARWTGTPSSGPVHGPGVVRVAVPAWAFAWTTYFGWSAEWTVVRQGGPRDHPLHGPRSVRVVRDAGPHMGFRVGRMIGPACGPLAHSHDVVRKRAGHADGPHASTWPIRPPGPWSTVLDAGHGPHGVGMIVDRAVLDGPWPLVDAALRVRSARPADSKGGGAVIGLRPLYRVRLCQVLFYSSCRFLVDGVVVTNGHEVVQCDVSRHSPCSDRFKNSYYCDDNCIHVLLVGQGRTGPVRPRHPMPVTWSAPRGRFRSGASVSGIRRRGSVRCCVRS